MLGSNVPRLIALVVDPEGEVNICKGLFVRVQCEDLVGENGPIRYVDIKLASESRRKITVVGVRPYPFFNGNVKFLIAVALLDVYDTCIMGDEYRVEVALISSSIKSDVVPLPCTQCN